MPTVKRYFEQTLANTTVELVEVSAVTRRSVESGPGGAIESVIRSKVTQMWVKY